jgi:malonyl-CoA decarboxylase
LLHLLDQSPGASHHPSVRVVRQAITKCQALISERGEVSGARLAADVLSAYESLDESGLESFFDLLSRSFPPEVQRLARTIEAYRATPNEANLAALQAAVESPRQELFRRFNLAPGGTRVLVDIRRRILSTLDAHPERAALEADLSHLLRSWFNRGFLVLQRIDWRTSALVLERLIQYEAVHQIQGWRDLRRRLEADRRCYAFFHPALPEEPLIFIEVALTRGMSANVQPLLDADAEVLDPTRCDCAIFYSITNCQEGLRGVSFGNFLIKQVVEDLGREFSRLRTFATLSPLPRFREWLSEPDGRKLASNELQMFLGHLNGASSVNELSKAEPFKQELIQLCAHYLLHAKTGQAPADPVAKFHLANGACLQRLNWAADGSEAGIRRSLGIMVNYVYSMGDLERNHEAYANEHEVIASHVIERLAKLKT